jgi:predicted ATPase/DNA-binding CsgD family transcriptional regulator
VCAPQLSSQPGNLPTPLSSFIGRRHEIAEVKQKLAEQRLLTLIGPGGCGKTRLSIRVARDLQPDFEHGAWLVELAALADPGLLPQAVASSLGVREGAGIPVLDSVITHLQARTALLVLDNCEHLLQASAQISTALLETCPGLQLLATSREPLGVPGEMVWIVPPLSLPEPQPWRSPGQERVSLSMYERSEAIQLFVVRASAAAPSFALTPQNGPWVAEICRRLDGIPLAIELAAARVRAFSVRQIAERLDDRFQLLTGGLRSVPARHQTLVATLDWSYDLLSEAERKLFARLSVFAGGWTLAAAEQIGAERGEQQEVMPGLSSLVDKSLVDVDQHFGEPRYRYLETIRQYAGQKLAQAGETHPARDRHLAYFTGWAEQNETHLTGANQAHWMEHFDLEHDNLRAALEWSLADPARAQTGLRLAVACAKFWRNRGHLNEGRSRLAAALEQNPARDPVHGPSLVRAQALLWAGALAYHQTDFPIARLFFEEGLALNRQLGPAGKPGMAMAFDGLGELSTEVGDYQQAQQYLEEALALYREMQHPRDIADMLMQLGWTAMRIGDYEQAAERLNECQLIFRQLGEFRLLGLALSGLGELSIRQGQYAQATVLLEQSLVMRRELGDRWGIATSLGSLGWVAMLEGDYDRMRTQLGESLKIRLELGERGGTAWCLEKLAEATSLQAQALPASLRSRGFRRAACLLGAAQALRRPLNSAIDLVDQPGFEQTLELLRAGLGETAFEAAWAEGGALPLHEIVDQALAPVVTPQELASLPAKQALKAEYGGLSARERETARLIAQGKTNREIAESMVVRVKTVETYVTRILNKLGFDSRVQIATWAVKAGLDQVAGNQKTPGQEAASQ